MLFMAHILSLNAVFVIYAPKNLHGKKENKHFFLATATNKMLVNKAESTAAAQIKVLLAYISKCLLLDVQLECNIRIMTLPWEQKEMSKEGNCTFYCGCFLDTEILRRMQLSSFSIFRCKMQNWLQFKMAFTVNYLAFWLLTKDAKNR